MMAACRNVETYAAAQVFYWVGFNGMAFVLDVFLADTSSLKNRALVFAFSTSPYIVTTFIGPRAAQSFLDTSGWPWGFGVYCIVTPLITIPILTLLWRNQRKALRLGLYKKERSGRTVAQAVPYYFWEFDGRSCPASIVTLLTRRLSHRSAPDHRGLCPDPPRHLAFQIST